MDHLASPLVPSSSRRNMDSVVYPEGKEEELRTLSACLSLLATTALSYCFAQRAYNLDWSWRGLASINVTKALLLIIFIDSWAFVFLSGLLVNGVGLSLNASTCSMGIFACIIFYCVSKLLTYVFLLEKVYIVWPNNGTRWSSWAYRVGFVAVLGFAVVLATMIYGRIAYIRDDNQCIIGLQKAASMTTLFVDLGVNVLLTSLFIWPLWRSNFLSANLRRVASRTLAASFAALAISAANMGVLTALHGKQLGFICLASCSTDVVINALVLFWLTKPGSSPDEPTSHGGQHGVHGPGHRSVEHGKSNNNNLIHMQRVSAAPGALTSFNATTSSTGGGGSGPSRPSFVVKAGGADMTDPNGARSPMKVNFGEAYSGVYDGSRPYVRSDNANLGKHNDDGMVSPPLTPTSSAAMMYGNRPQTASKDQRRHSSSVVYENTVSVEGNGRPGFFSRFMGRSPTPIGRSQHASTGSVQFTSFPGLRKGKKRTGSEEDIGVRVTITTHFENDGDIDAEVAARNETTSTIAMDPELKKNSSPV